MIVSFLQTPAAPRIGNPSHYATIRQLSNLKEFNKNILLRRIIIKRFE